ncbi:MAG: hypothetical protein ACQUHE_18345 [Bacteroidia bacterium]
MTSQNLLHFQNDVISLKAADQMQLFSSATLLSGAMLSNVLNNMEEEFSLQLEIFSFSETLHWRKTNLNGSDYQENNFRYDNDIPAGTMKSFFFKRITISMAL